MANHKGVFRVNDWWRSKVAMLMGMIYLFTAWLAIPLEKFLPLATLSVFTIIGFAAMGYLLNDFFDREKDLKAGKENFLLHKSPLQVIFFFVTAFGFLLLPWIALPYDNISLLLIVTEIFLLILYSLPPVRLKEKGMAGIVVDSLYAHTVPVLLAFHTYVLAGQNKISALPVILLTIWQFASGSRNIILHQIEDVLPDGISGTKSWVASKSEKKVNSVLISLTAVELLSSIFLFLALAFYNPQFLSIVFIILLLIFFTSLRFRERSLASVLRNTTTNFPNNIFEGWIPPVLLLLLACSNIFFLPVFFLHVAFFSFNFYRQLVNRMLLPLAYTVKVVIIESAILVRRVISLLVNLPIYYAFLLFGINLKKEKMSALEYLKSIK